MEPKTKKEQFPVRIADDIADDLAKRLSLDEEIGTLGEADYISFKCSWRIFKGKPRRVVKLAIHRGI
jgi:hypothetical protein